MKNKLEIYALSVCFAAVVCIIVSAGIAGYSVFSVVMPEITMINYKYDKFQSNEAYWESKDYSSTEEGKKDKPSEEELTKQRTEAYETALNAEKREGVQLLIKCLMFLLVSGITLYIHSKIAKSARAN